MGKAPHLNLQPLQQRLQLALLLCTLHKPAPQWHLLPLLHLTPGLELFILPRDDAHHRLLWCARVLRLDPAKVVLDERLVARDRAFLLWRGVGLDQLSAIAGATPVLCWIDGRRVAAVGIAASGGLAGPLVFTLDFVRVGCCHGDAEMLEGIGAE